MSSDAANPTSLLQQDTTCEVIRAILASGSGCTVADLCARLSQPAHSLQELLSSLVGEGLVMQKGTHFVLKADFNTDSPLREAILEYEKRWLARRAKAFPIDVLSRFRVTEALGQMINHARSTLK